MNKIEPKISHPRVKGCIFYVLIDTHNLHRSTLSPTSLRGKFIGYCESPTQYRVYVPSKAGKIKVLVSANARFFEDSFWNWSKSSHEQYGELETLSEEEPANISINSSGEDQDTEEGKPEISESFTPPSSPSLVAPTSAPSVASPLPSSIPAITVKSPLDLGPIRSSGGAQATASPSSQTSPLNLEVQPDLEEPLSPRRSKRKPKPIPPRSVWQPTPRVLYVDADIPIPQSHRDAIEEPNSER